MLERARLEEILQDRAASVIERRFVLPHIAHAPHEPVNATASYKNGAVEVWGPIQSVTRMPGGGRISRRMLAGRRDGERHFSRRELRPQDRSGLRGASRPCLQGSRATGQAYSLARGGHPARRLPAERRRAASRGRGRCRLSPGRRRRVSLANRLFAATRRSWLEQTPDGAWDESMVDGIYNQSYRCRTSWWRQSTRRCRSRSTSCDRSARPRRCSSGRA